MRAAAAWARGSRLARQAPALVLLWAATAAGATPAAPPATSMAPTAPSTPCAGYPRVALRVPAGWCAGLALTAADGLRMPRRLLEVSPGQFWLVDMGSWEPRRGRLLALDLSGARQGPARVQVLAQGLDRPHGLARGPDGRRYIGEAGSVWRTPPGASVQRETVLQGLPADGAHPLKELAFGPAGQLYLNVGSATDACRDARQQQPLPCPETLGPLPRAAVWVATLGGPGQTLQSLRPHATGLRNSLGLAALPDGAVWQAENSVDYTEADQPAEELNRLGSGSHHGWPECVSDSRGRSVPARGYAGRARCPASTAPVQAWPAHVAPLQLWLAPPAPAGQPVTPWAGHLLAVWHGYRPAGHRIVAWRLDGGGRPSGPRRELVSGWQAQPGVRPMGAPAGVTVDHQGRLWIVDDRNRQVLVVARDAP